MAIKKEIKMDNGITLSYHRISKIDIEVNQQVTFLVESYIDETGRNYEKAYANGEIDGEPKFPYTNAKYIHIPYDETTEIFQDNAVKQAYELLKSSDLFVGAIDV